MTSNVCEIEKLVNLFQTSQNENNLDDENDDSVGIDNSIQCSYSGIQCAEAKGKNKKSPYDKITSTEERKEVLDGEVDEFYFDANDDEGRKNWKITPHWEVSYRQTVTASDVFLGMSFKNPSTNSCENMVITVDLPGENRQNIDLKVEEDRLELNSPKHFLKLTLPHPVNPKLGNAQFNQQSDQLIITLVMARELDLVNF